MPGVNPLKPKGIVLNPILAKICNLLSLTIQRFDFTDIKRNSLQP